MRENATEIRTRLRRRHRDAARRMLDLAVAIPSLILLSPLLIVLAVVVRARLGRPVLFRQQRPGLHAVPFTLLKFRTMRDGLGLSNEANLTRLGRFLRRTSFDELPQLFNVLKGDMSLVGPRPLLMAYLDRYSPEEMRRHEVKPGITGWCQINGRNALTWAERFTLDLWYVDNRSFLLDCRILLRTIWTVVKREGVDPPGKAAVEEFTSQRRGSTGAQGSDD